jgi:hypothetical protein
MTTPCYDLYVDDSGSRSLDITPSAEEVGPDAFALGGILVPSEQTALLADRVRDLKSSCGIEHHLRSYEIRNKKNRFAWMAKDAERAKRLYAGINALVTAMPAWATAVVIDRTGYGARYRGKHGKDRWELCKSAYDILIERAAKIASCDGRRLKVFVEMTGPREDNLIRQYHANLRTNGLEFAAPNSSKYRPLAAEDFARLTMKNPQFTRKGNPLSDLADLVLFPLVMAKFKPEYGPYRHLCDTGKIIDARLVDGPADCGVKYYCFDDPKYWP